MPLFSEQDNPASFSPYILTRLVEVHFCNFTWYSLNCFIILNDKLDFKRRRVGVLFRLWGEKETTIYTFGILFKK